MLRQTWRKSLMNKMLLHIPDSNPVHALAQDGGAHGIVFVPVNAHTMITEAIAEEHTTWRHGETRKRAL